MAILYGLGGAVLGVVLIIALLALFYWNALVATWGLYGAALVVSAIFFPAWLNTVAFVGALLAAAASVAMFFGVLRSQLRSG